MSFADILLTFKTKLKLKDDIKSFKTENFVIKGKADASYYTYHDISCNSCNY